MQSSAGSDVDDSVPAPPVSRRADRARAALIGAAARLLPRRAPSTISGRDLAAEAGVNYGLIHHYFGSKDAVLVAGLDMLRDDFVRSRGDISRLRLLTDDEYPFLQAWARSHVDYPDTVTANDDFPIGTALHHAVRERLAQRTSTELDRADPDLEIEAQARVIAMVSIQIGYAVFGRVMREGADVAAADRRAVELRLAAIYDELSMLEEPGGAGGPR